MANAQPCVFCSPRILSEAIVSNEVGFVVPDINPDRTPIVGSYVFIPREHAKHPHQLSCEWDKTLEELFNMLSETVGAKIDVHYTNRSDAVREVKDHAHTKGLDLRLFDDYVTGELRLPSIRDVGSIVSAYIKLATTRSRLFHTENTVQKLTGLRVFTE